MMRLFLLIIAVLLPLPGSAADQSFTGIWEGADTAAMSIYGTLNISATKLSWGGHSKFHPVCSASYVVVPEAYGIEFKDQVGRTYISSADSKFTTYLLKIKGGKCTNGISYFRLTIEDGASNDLAMVEYRDLNQPVGWVHFSRP